MIKILLILIFIIVKKTSTIQNCPMTPIKDVILRASEVATDDAPLQMQIIRKIMEDMYGGSWGVIIISDISLISDTIHWTIPDSKNEDDSPAFCLQVQKKWQYNVFRTGEKDNDDRMKIEDVIREIKEQKIVPKKITSSEFDKKLTNDLGKKWFLRLSETH
uniref:Dynein light chain n=1 Tax=Parastrongyloides trichosuri TaxID=131310 RepID=A0A0N4ZRK4_PARTI